MAKPPKATKDTADAARKSKAWAERRKGFKHELILTLSALEFSVRRAEEIVEATLDVIVEALQRKEGVAVEGFGVWRVCTTPQRRGWRFGKVVIFKHYKVAFEPDNTAIFSARDPKWTGHAAWQNSRKKAPEAEKRPIGCSVGDSQFRDFYCARKQYSQMTHSAIIVRHIVDILDTDTWRELIWNWSCLPCLKKASQRLTTSE